MVTMPFAAKNQEISSLATTLLVEDFETDAKLSPVLEKKGILGNSTGRRPGDVTFEKWAEGKGLAVDVAH